MIDNREEELPEVGRYNAGQKLLFFTIVVCLIGLLLSGIVIWRVYFSAFFPIGVIRLASLLHAFCAFVLICAIIVHIYAAIWVKGSIRAMTRGWVTPGWAWKHHRAWFREVTKGAHCRSSSASARSTRFRVHSRSAKALDVCRGCGEDDLISSRVGPPWRNASSNPVKSRPSLRRRYRAFVCPIAMPCLRGALPRLAQA